MLNENYVKKEYIEVVGSNIRKRVPIEKDTYIGSSSLLHHYDYTDIPYTSDIDIDLDNSLRNR